MGFSWSTFLIEIVNFIVLVWILRRFLYQPVLRVIAARQTAIREELHSAEEMRKQNDERTKRYESRLADWEAEKAQLRAVSDKEMSDERAKREAKLRGELQRERERAATVAHARERDGPKFTAAGRTGCRAILRPPALAVCVSRSRTRASRCGDCRYARTF